MDITPLIPKGTQVINRYGDGGFVINGMTHKGNILLMPAHVLPWQVASINDAMPESLTPLLAGELPEIVLIGVGPRLMPLSPALRALLREKNIACDAMDTGAACRTYSVLLAEGRQVAAALIAV